MMGSVFCLSQESKSALFIFPSEFDAIINFEDLLQKIVGMAFTPSESVTISLIILVCVDHPSVVEPNCSPSKSKDRAFFDLVAVAIIATNAFV